MEKPPEVSHNWLEDENIRISSAKDCCPVIFHDQDSFENFQWECSDNLMQIETLSVLVDDLYIVGTAMKN